MTTSPANSSRFSIAIHGMDDSFRLTALKGASAIGDLYQYDICCASKSQKIKLEDLLNHSVLVTVHDLSGGKAPRFLRGIVSEASYLNQGKEYSEYRLTVVPALWVCTQKHNFRIFQEQTPNAIITQILKEHGIQGDLFSDQTSSAPQRNYCVQYGESDYAFITRLMQEEGWHYHFQNTDQKQILILADTNKVFNTKSGSETLRYEQESSRPQDEECVHQLNSRYDLTTGAIRIGDFSFEKPTLGLQAFSKGQFSQLEHYHHPGQFMEPGRGKQLSQRYLEQAEHQLHLIDMETHSIHCEAGQWMSLEKHPNAKLNQRYLIIHSELIAEQPQSLDSGASNKPPRCISRLRCIPFTTPFRPYWGHVKPMVSGPHNAIVTGPKGEEIYTDRYGRIKAQFYWDREGQGNENTSCWIRVNQPMAGVQWGGIALPRIGQEVIIEFEHGDPDRPVMTGRVYNGQNLPPYTLPANKTRSALKSLSSPGGGGYHELRLEDKKGSEQIFIRSEKDLDLRILNDLKSHTDNDQHLSVGGQLAEETGKDHHSTIGANQNDDVGQNLSITTGKDLHLKISGAHVIESGNAIHIKAGSKAILQGGTSLSVKAGAGVITLDPSGVAIMGPLVRINEGGGGGSAQAANPTQPGNPAEADNDAPGAKLRAASAASTPLPAAIDFDRAKAQLAALQQADAMQAPFVEECPECALFTQQQGALAAGEPVPEAEEESDTLGLVCIDADGSPAANLPYSVTLADGSTRNGTLNSEGKAQLSGVTPGNATVEYTSDADEAEIQATRKEIAGVLTDIIACEYQEKAAIDAEYAKQGALGQWWEEEKAKARGAGKSVLGLLSFLKEANDLTPLNQFINAHKVAWDSWRNTDDRPYLQRFADNFTESQFKETADVLGFDPRSISREDLANAWAMANFVWDDPETQKLLIQFGGDYIAAQHKLEILEFGAGAATEIAIDVVITALTAGAGAALIAGTKLHYLDKFKALGPLFNKLAELRKKLFKKGKKTGHTGGEIPEQLGKPEAVELKRKRTPDELDSSVNSKRIAPTGLADAENILKERRTQIASEGYKPKYSDEELAHMAQHSDVGDERFQVRFMEEGYLNDRDTPDQVLSGKMGVTMEGATGKGAKYWSTSLDQIEDADTDPKLISEKLGLEYNPDKKYALVIVDTEKSTSLTGVKSVPATFEKVSEFANTELPKDFPKNLTDEMMTPEFQTKYAEQYQTAVDQKYLPDLWSKDTAGFNKYLKSTGMLEEERNIMLKRMQMHDKIGNNQEYLGNGLTKDLNPNSANEFGAVETLNFERREVNLKQLQDAGAINIITGLTPL